MVVTVSQLVDPRCGPGLWTNDAINFDVFRGLKIHGRKGSEETTQSGSYRALEKDGAAASTWMSLAVTILRSLQFSSQDKARQFLSDFTLLQQCAEGLS